MYFEGTIHFDVERWRLSDVSISHLDSPFRKIIGIEVIPVLYICNQPRPQLSLVGSSGFVDRGLWRQRRNLLQPQ